jgi:hypothetical protein
MPIPIRPRWLPLLLWFSLLLPLPAQPAINITTTTQRGHQTLIKIGSDVLVKPEETVDSVVVIGGNTTIEGEVRHATVVLFGNADVRGRVNGDLVVVAGEAKVDSEAYLGGNLVTVDGTATGQPALRVGKNRVEISLGKKQPSLLWLGQYLREGILKGRPFPPQVRWVWGWALLFLLLHLMAVWVFPRGVQATADTLASRPVASLGMGLLTVVLAGPVLGLLTLTVVGLVAVPFLGCALVVALWFGKAGLYTCTGQRAGRLLGANLLPQPVLALVIGTGLLYFTYMLPWLGFPMLGTMTLLAVGSATLAALTPARREALTPPPATATPSPAPMSFAGPVPPVVPAMPIPLVSAPGEQPPAMPMADGRVNNLDIGWTGADVDYATLPRVGFWRRLAASALDLLLFGGTAGSLREIEADRLVVVPLHPLGLAGHDGGRHGDGPQDRAREWQAHQLQRGVHPRPLGHLLPAGPGHRIFLGGLDAAPACLARPHRGHHRGPRPAPQNHLIPTSRRGKRATAEGAKVRGSGARRGSSGIASGGGTTRPVDGPPARCSQARPPPATAENRRAFVHPAADGDTR